MERKEDRMQDVGKMDLDVSDALPLCNRGLMRKQVYVRTSRSFMPRSELARLTRLTSNLKLPPLVNQSAKKFT